MSDGAAGPATGKRSIQSGRRRVLKDAGRALGGALVFSLPMLMTMEMWEMWWLGFYMDPLRLLLLLVLSVPLLAVLSRYVGFEATSI